MTEVTRREALALTGAAAAVASLPASAVAAAVTPPALPAWIVGTPGEFDALFVRAKDKVSALKAWTEETWGHGECDRCDDDTCGICQDVAGAEASRISAWDGIEGEPTTGDWLDAGFGTYCDRCSDELFGGRNVEGAAVCDCCMTLDDWDKVEPEYAAELRAEQAMIDAALEGEGK